METEHNPTLPPAYGGGTVVPPRAPHPQQRKFSDTISFKILFIVILILVLLIPDAFIFDAISGRERNQRKTMDEISNQWSKPQTVTGPMLVIPYEIKKSGKKDTVVEHGRVTVLPASMNFDAGLSSRVLRRGIYEDVVYNSKIKIDGAFDLSTLQPSGIPFEALHTDRAILRIGITDLRGIERITDFTLQDSVYELSGNHTGSQSIDKDPDYDYVYLADKEPVDIETYDSFLASKIDVGALIGNDSVPYSCEIDLKGSHAMSVAPLGKSTEIKISGDCSAPSFNGMFLPSDRTVGDGEFSAVWNLNAVNRDYPQVYTSDNTYAVRESVVTADLLVPVDRYQKTERSVKYAVLVFLLTFIAVLFSEVILKHRIYVFQYLLVGLALVLFYSLLLSLSEHMTFGFSYLIAALMTIGLVGLYMRGVLRNVKVAAYISALLTVIYAYIFVLLNLETFALLAGSLGLFIALAAIMYASLKMDWKSV